MKKIEYNIPVYEDEDVADLKEYSEKIAEALKEQVDKFGNPLIFKGRVEELEDLDNLTDVENGHIYLVKSENKNYIFNGTDWKEYSENKSLEAGDSLPVGTIVEFDGDTVPDGYEEVEENEIVVSAEEPTENRKRVWIQKGKNLFDKNNANKFYGYFSATAGFDSAGNNDPNKTFYIECIPNCTYTVSKIAGERFRVGTSKNIPKAGESLTEVKTNTKGTQLTITSGTEDKYLSVYYMDITADTLTEQEILDSIQIEQGSTATSYEAYVENKIFIKNGNDVYEELKTDERIRKELEEKNFLEITKELAPVLNYNTNSLHDFQALRLSYSNTLKLNINGTEYPNNSSVLCFSISCSDNVNFQLGVVTWCDTSTVRGKVIYRYSHGANLSNTWKALN